MKILNIKNLNVAFPGSRKPVSVLDNVSLEIRQGESLGIVGESGSGKTMVALSIMGLAPPRAIVKGSINFRGQSLLSMRESQMRKIRGRQMAMIFEQPATCLNPVFPIGDQIAEIFRIHGKCSRRDSKNKTIDLLEKVGIDSPEKRYAYYPHEFSGGMAQRIMIAMAMAFKPVLMIADEPTASLDVSLQTRIIGLMLDLIKEYSISLLLITHDLGVAARLCGRIAVMYAGSVMEYGKLKRVFKQPAHPYTKALTDVAKGRDDNLIEGFVPMPGGLPQGCRFIHDVHMQMNLVGAPNPPWSAESGAIGPEHASNELFVNVHSAPRLQRYRSLEVHHHSPAYPVHFIYGSLLTLTMSVQSAILVISTP